MSYTFRSGICFSGESKNNVKQIHRFSAQPNRDLCNLSSWLLGRRQVPGRPQLLLRRWLCSYRTSGCAWWSYWYDVTLDFFEQGQKEENHVGIDSGIETSWVIKDDEYINMSHHQNNQIYTQIRTHLFSTPSSQIYTHICLRSLD